MNQPMFKLATKQDLDDIFQIIESAKIHLKINKINQWQDGYPTKQVFEKDIENGHSFIMTIDNQIAGVVTLSDSVDPAYSRLLSGKWIVQCDNYVNIYRMAISPKHRQKGIACLMLKQAEQYCKKNKKSSLRTYTTMDNFIMGKLLKKNCYEYCAQIDIGDAFPRVAFEKSLLNDS